MIYRTITVFMAMTALIIGVQTKNHFGIVLGAFTLAYIASEKRND